MAEGALITLRDTQPLSVDVSELLRRPGATLRLKRTVRMEGLTVPLARVEGSDLTLDLRLDALADGLNLSGTVEGDLAFECRRCLTDVHERARWTVAEVFAEESDEDDPDAYPVIDESIDLEPMLRDAIVLALPANPLCRPDCKGLCPVCGADRNTTDCGHDAGRVDVRWGPLETLRERLEG